MREGAVILRTGCRVVYAEAWRRTRLLKGTTMTSSAPKGPEERRIIPLRPLAAIPPSTTSDETGSASTRDRGDAARHYLKFMLPSIPVATFILTFVLCYVLLGLSGGSLSAAAAVHGEPVVAVDPTLPFLGALLLGLATGILCMWIYFGYVRISGSDTHHRT